MNQKTISCLLCGSTNFCTIHKGVRGNANIDVLKCELCGLVRLSDFINDSDEYYKTSEMRKGEIESTLAEIRSAAYTDDKRRADFISRMIENKNYLDFGCGAGGVLSLVSNKVKSAYGIELETRMVDSLRQEHICCFSSLEQAKTELKEPIDVISLFHVLEHIEDPFFYLNELKSILSDDGIMIIEVPNANDALLSLYENDAFSNFTYWESHLYLYDNTTFSILMKKAGLRIRFLGQVQRYPLSNTMYWLSKGMPGGHKYWSMLSNEALDREYEKTLAGLGIADTIMAVVEKEK